MALSAGSLSVPAATMWQKLQVGPQKLESNYILNGKLDGSITSWSNVENGNQMRVLDPWGSCAV